MTLPQTLIDRIYFCTVTGCWLFEPLWNTGDGYSKLRWEGRIWRAHRLIWTLTHGEIPEGLVLDHKCRNRGCINPDHLEPVTVRENTHRGDAILIQPSLKRTAA